MQVGVTKDGCPREITMGLRAGRSLTPNIWGFLFAFSASYSSDYIWAPKIILYHVVVITALQSGVALRCPKYRMYSAVGVSLRTLCGKGTRMHVIVSVDTCRFAVLCGVLMSWNLMAGVPETALSAMHP